MNTQFNYKYRDAGNYKTFYSYVFEGEISPEQISRFVDLCADEMFIPRALGLSGGVLPGEDGYDDLLDHYWCEHDFEDSFELVNDAPDVFKADGKSAIVKINEFLKGFEHCSSCWENALANPISLYGEKATYISCWDTGAIIEFPCKVNLDTKEVYDVEFDADVLDDFEVFQGEKVRLEDGTEYELCSKSDLDMIKDGFWHVDSCVIGTQDIKPSLSEQIQTAENQVVADNNLFKVDLSKDELNLIVKALDVVGDRVADKEGYSAGEKYWYLKEKLEGVVNRFKGVERSDAKEPERE